MPTLSFQTIAQLIPKTCEKLYIAYSGGIDSHVLLHLCAMQAHLRDRIVAVYVNHGLQVAAADWGEHCRGQAETLGVAFRCLNVDAKAANGESPEAAARNARYRALEKLLQPGDLLLLAQHREDQMETVLLQLFRGAGIQGLSAMPVTATFGLGRLIRPLLTIAKADIQNYAAQHDLKWIEDPTNQQNDFDRNFLRNEILPLLKQRWPSLDKTVARSAQHCGAALDLLTDWGNQALSQLTDPENKSLAIDKLIEYNDDQSNWLLRHWCQALGLKPPSQALLQAIKQQLVKARDDAAPQIQIQAHVLKKYRERLYCLQPKRLTKLALEYDWPAEQAALLLPNDYALRRINASSGIDQALWHCSKITLKPRSGGEKLKLPGRQGRHDLKKLFQEADIPPWERETRPLIYLDERLAAVAGLWIAEWAWREAPDACYQLTWQPYESV